MQIEEDVYQMLGTEQKEEPVILDVESIRVTKPGKYEIDLVPLFKGDPLIYKVGDGKYVIDLIRSFNELGKKE